MTHSKARWSWSSFWSAVSALAAAVAVVFAWIASTSADRISMQAQVSEQMSRYLTAYSTTAADLDNPFSLEGYLKLHLKDRVRVEIVAGLQIVLVDLMFEAKDARKDTWLDYIGIPGPTACGNILPYARHPKTTAFLKRKMDEYKMKKVDCSLPPD